MFKTLRRPPDVKNPPNAIIQIFRYSQRRFPMAPGQIATQSSIGTQRSLKNLMKLNTRNDFQIFFPAASHSQWRTKYFSFTYLIEIKLINFVISRIFSCRNDGRVSENWCRWRHSRAINLQLIRKNMCPEQFAKCEGRWKYGNSRGNGENGLKFMDHLESSYIPSSLLSDDMWYSDCPGPSRLG